MAYRDLIQDDALAAAKAHSHAAVEPRHVLWAIVEVLGSNAPDDLKTADVQPLPVPGRDGDRLPHRLARGRHDPDRDHRRRLGDRPGPHDPRVTRRRNRRRGDRRAGRDADAGHRRRHDGHGATASDTTAATSTSTAAASTPSTPATAGGKEPLELILAELDALVGMTSVKAEVRRLVAVQRLNGARRAAGLPEIDATNHLVFTGPPGTGKTTVARIIGRLYGTLGVVTKGHLVEATRADLVAAYVGRRRSRSRRSSTAPSAASCSSTRPTRSRPATWRTTAARPSRPS